MNHQSSRCSIPLCLLFVSLVLPPCLAHDDELPFDVFVMPPEPISGVEIRWEDLFDPQGPVPEASTWYGPFHGDVTETAGGLYYTARQSLWQAKVDSFVLDYYLGKERHTANVAIVVGTPHKGEVVYNSFDNMDTTDSGHPDWYVYDPNGGISIVDSTLLVRGSSLADSYVFTRTDDHPLKWPPLDLYDTERVHAGSSTTGTGGGVVLDPPEGRVVGDPAVSPAPSGEYVFYSSGEPDSVKGWLRRQAGILQACVEAEGEDGNWRRSLWVNVPDSGGTRLEVEYDHAELSPEVVRLKVDGLLATRTLEFEAGELTELNEHRFGILQLAGRTADLWADEAEVYRYRIHGEEEPHHTDDFEVAPGGGPFADWTGTSGNGLAVIERQPVGMHWLRVDLDSSPSYLIDEAHEAADRVRLRFDVDTSEMNAMAVKTVALHRPSAPGDLHDSEHLRVWMRRDWEGAWVKVGVLASGALNNTWRVTGWQPLAEADVNRVVLTLRTASTPEAADGELRVWLDGVELPAIQGLANHENLVETVKFGAVDLGPGDTGQIYLDNFQLWVPHDLELSTGM